MSKTNRHVNLIYGVADSQGKINVFSVSQEFIDVLGFLIYLQKIWSWDDKER